MQNVVRDMAAFREDPAEASAQQIEAARLTIGRLVEQGRLDANAATRQLLSLDLQVRQSRSTRRDAPGSRTV